MILDTEMAAIREWLRDGPRYLAVAPAIVRELLDEVDRLEAENVALRELRAATGDSLQAAYNENAQLRDALATYTGTTETIEFAPKEHRA